jgi:hypothetical protein
MNKELIMTAIIVVVCLMIGIGTSYYKGDNNIEEVANAVINQELGTDIDISDLLDELMKESEPKMCAVEDAKV